MKRVGSWFAIGIAALIFSGCNAGRVSMTGNDLVVVETVNSDKVFVVWSEVYQQDGQSWVRGELKQDGYRSSAIKTHVDIQVNKDDGSLDFENISQNVYVPRSQVGKSQDQIRFKVKLDRQVQSGSKVAIKVCTDEHGLAAETKEAKLGMM